MQRLSQKDFSRELRRSLTPTERRFWSLVRDRQAGGLKTRRQHTVGPYVVDFCCHSARLVIELDGSIHADPARAASDAERQMFLEAGGYRVIRFRNREVMEQPEAVLAAVVAAASL